EPERVGVVGLHAHLDGRFAVGDGVADEHVPLGEVDVDRAVRVLEVEADREPGLLRLRADLGVGDRLLEDPSDAVVDVLGVAEQSHVGSPSDQTRYGIVVMPWMKFPMRKRGSPSSSVGARVTSPRNMLLSM